MKKNVARKADNGRARRKQERKARTRRLREAKRRISLRLQVAREQRALRWFAGKGPILNEANLKYELGERASGIVHGGVPLMLKLAQQVGLPDFINNNVQLLKDDSKVECTTPASQKRSLLEPSRRSILSALGSSKTKCVTHESRSRTGDFWSEA